MVQLTKIRWEREINLYLGCCFISNMASNSPHLLELDSYFIECFSDYSNENIFH